MLTTPSDKISTSSRFLRTVFEKMKPCNSNPVIANAGAPQTTSTSSPSVSAFSPHLHQFRRDLQHQANPELHPNSHHPSPQHLSLQVDMEVDGNGKMSSGRTYNWLSIYLRWSDLLMKDQTFLRHSMKSKAWLTIGGFTHLINLLSTHYDCDEFVCQQWRQHDTSRIR